METIVINDSTTELYAGGGKWLTQSGATCYREFHRRVLVAAPMKAEAWTEWTDAQKRAWEGNPPRALDRDNPADALLGAWWEEAFTIRNSSGLVVKRYGRVNYETGYCEGNGLENITGAQALAILTAGPLVFSGGEVSQQYCTDVSIRTNCPVKYAANYCSANYTFSSCMGLEVVNGRYLNFYISTVSGCRRLRRIIEPIRLSQSIETFRFCEALEEMELVLTNRSALTLQLKDSPRLSYATFRYMIDRSEAQGAVVVVVHRNVYAKLTGDTTNGAAAALTLEELARWTQLLADAAAKNITFTTTE